MFSENVTLMIKKMQKVTIIEVAKKAGVSPTTVSRVLNNKTEGHMREETKQRILEVIKKLDYTPNKFAQFIKKQKSGVIGVLVPDISNQFFSLMVRGIENISYRNGYSIIICDAENSLNKESEYIDILLKERVEGVILTSSGTKNEKVEKLIRRNIPLVLAVRRLKNIDAPYVGSDGVRDSYILTKYLISLGYRKIGFVKGPYQAVSAIERFEGYKKAMSENSLTVDKDYIKEGDYTFEGGYKAGREFTQSSDKLPQAIIAANDLMALGIIRAFEDKGLKVPQDVAVAGMDNIPFSSLFKPRLTTVEIPAYTIGQDSAKVLLNYIKMKEVEKPNIIKIVDTKLIRGESCKKRQ